MVNFGGGGFGGGGAGRDGSNKPGFTGGTGIVVRAPTTISGGGGGSRAIPIPDESQLNQIKAEQERQAQAKAQAQAAALQSEARARQETIARQTQTQSQASAILSQAERDLAEKNLAARRAYQEKINSGVERGEARSELDTQLGQNRINYFVERAKSGKPYKDKNISIEKNAGGGIDIIDKKTSQSVTVTPAEIVQSEIKPVLEISESASPNILMAPSRFERFQGAVREKLGVSVPSLRNVKESFNVLFKGAEEGSPEQVKGVNALDVIAAPVYGVEQLSSISGQAAKYDVEQLGFPGIDVKLQPKAIPQRITVGAQGFATPQTPESIKVFTPEDIGTGVALGTGFALSYPFNIGLLGASTFAGGSSKALDTTLSSGERLSGGAQALIGGLLTTGYLREPIVKPLKSPEARYASKEVIQPIIRDGKQVEAVRFDLQRTVPEQKVTFIKRYQQPFFSPQEVLISPKRIDTIRTLPFYVKEGEIQSPALFKMQREGAQMYFYGKLEGKQVKVLPEEFSKLTPIQKFQVKQIIEAKTGRPVSDVNAPGMIPKEGLQLSVGEIESNRFLRVSPSSETATLIGYGKRTTRGSTFGTAKPILETPEFSIFETKMSAKDINSPLAKATGKPIIVEGVSKVKKPIDITPSDADVNFIVGNKPMQTQKVETAKAQQASMGAQANLAKQFPIVKDVAKPTARLSSAEYFPLIVRGTEKAEGAFARTGQYEQSIQTVNPKLIIGVSEKSMTKQEDRFGLKDVQNQTIVGGQKVDQFTKLGEFQVPASDQFQGEEQKQRQNLKSGQFQKSDRTEDNILKKIAPPVTFGKKSKSSLKGKSALFSKIKRAFTVVTYKGGKEQVIGKGLPEGRAKKLGAETVLRTLRASFKLKPAGTTSQEDIDYNLASNIFAPSKRDASRFVQRRNLRLSARPEVSEILRTNRKRGKKIKWF